MNHLTKTKENVTIKSEIALETISRVNLSNCYCHTFDEAVAQIIMAIGCSYDAARQYADSAEKHGSVVVFTGPYKKCIEVANILGNTGLEVGIF